MVTKEFLLAGRSVFTVEIPEPFQIEGKHFTFKVRRTVSKENREIYFLRLQSVTPTRYIGILNPRTGDVKLTKASTFTPQDYVVRLVSKVLKRIFANDSAAIEKWGFQVHHEGRCGRCGRALTTPESLKRGIGPECNQMMLFQVA